MKARCIAIEHRRCLNSPARRSGDIFVCSRHAGLITMLLLDDRLAPETRRMLAHSRWENTAQAQALIDRMHAKRTA